MNRQPCAKVPPLSNRGGVSGEIYDAPQRTIERYQRFVRDEKGEIREIPLRRGLKDGAFIDTLSVTFHGDSLKPFGLLFLPMASEADYIKIASKVCYDIFGFGITKRGNGSGNRRYEGFWILEADGVQYGSVHYGGQNGTMLWELNGHGCQAAKDRWEGRLYSFLKGAVRPKITRIDIAADFFENEITPDKAYRAWCKRQFAIRQNPTCERYGSDWDCGTENGKTLYIGGKKASKRARIYDKAKQLGDKTANWTRFEIQFRGSKDLLLELEMLLWPGEYFGGAFPICEKLVGVQRRIEATGKKLELTIETAVCHGKNQVGRLINALLHLGKTNEQIIEMLRNKEGALPQRLEPSAYSVEYASGNDKYRHEPDTLDNEAAERKQQLHEVEAVSEMETGEHVEDGDLPY